jgi:TonB-linked SusC/RagA family outer membrane protein
VVQQTNTVKGTVTDESGEPLIGVTVTERGTSNRAITDIDGKFTINVAAGKVLIFSYVGYNDKAVNAKSGMSVVMATQNNDLDEIVVVGYGTSKRRDLISSVSTVRADEISNIPVTNIAQGLAGRSPGLIVTASGGGINTVPTVSIRGGDTPLYVIDGVVRDAADFQNLSPDDIETMSILKDASATAIYGSRASNGIIQVVTKSGKSGRIAIDYDFNQSFTQPNVWPRNYDAVTQAQWANQARANDGLTPIYDETAMQKLRDGTDPLNYSNIDVRDLALRDWAPQQKHTVRVTGGNEINRFYVSLGHIDQQSLYKANTNWMKRTNFRLSETALIKPIHLQVKATIDGYRQETSHPYTTIYGGYWDVFNALNSSVTMTPVYNSLGLPYNAKANLVADLKDGGYKRNIQNVINGKGELLWSVPWVDGLQVRLSSDYRYYSGTNKQWRKDAALYDWDSTIPRYHGKPLLYHDSSSGYAFTNQAFVEYSQQFGKHSVSALGGFEQYYTKGESYWEQRENYDFTIDQISVGPVNDMKNGGSESELGRAAWIWQLKYNYAEKYYAEFSMRNDGSDYFAPGHRWGTFFSGSLGWVVTEEAFMKPLVERNILNSLKLRGSYGETGLDSSAGRFAYLTSYTLNNQSYVVGGSYVPGFSEGSLPSPDLTWYTTRQTDIGFDFSSLNNRLYGSFDYFYYSTKGYLMSPTGQSYLNTAIGIGMPQVKSDSEFRRAGWELQLGWRDNVGAFKYDIMGNMTMYNTIWALNQSEAESSYMNPFTRTQQRKQDYFAVMYHNLGFYTSAQDILNSPGFNNAYNSGWMTSGDLKYEDINGDGKIDDADRRRVGHRSTPRAQFGLQTNFQWKGFYLSMLFQGATAFDMNFNPGTNQSINNMQTGQSGNLLLKYKYQTDHWRLDNQDNPKFPRLMSDTNLNASNNYAQSDFWLINGAYLRMKDFQFGYDFKYSLLRRVAWLTRCKVGVSGQNIFTISEATKYGLDPENAATSGYAYPVERVLALTLNLGF